MSAESRALNQEKPRASKMALPHSISHKNVRDPPEVRQGDPTEVREGDPAEFREEDPLRLG